MTQAIECVGVSLIELKAGVCRWMVGADSYCGAPAPVGSSWCARHAKIVYEPAVVRRRTEVWMFKGMAKEFA
jgi:hypothetical protein